MNNLHIWPADPNDRLQPIAAGGRGLFTVAISVAVLLGEGRYLISNVTSIIIAAPPPRPAIKDILPPAAGPGATVRVKGTIGSFAAAAENNLVTFLQGERRVTALATAVDVLGSTLTVNVPAGLSPGLADITVTSTFRGVASEPSSRFAFRVTGTFVLNVPILLNGYNTLAEDAYVTGLALANPTGQKTLVSLTAYNPDGVVMPTDPNPVELVIGPGEQIPITFAELFGLGPARPGFGWCSRTWPTT